MPKETLRRREQKAAAFAVRSGTAQRRPIEAEEARAFFRAIDARDAAGFGIRKLSLLDVDGLHEAPECIAWEDRITLLYYAAWRKRDHFVNALLKARANPSVRDDGVGELAQTETAMHIVDGLRMESAVWLCHALVQLRFRGNRLKETDAQCEDCALLQSQRASKGLAPSLAWPCGHRCCEACLWDRVANLASSKGVSTAAELLCPNCQVSPCQEARGAERPPETKKEDWQCGSCGYSNFARRETCRNCQMPRHISPEADDASKLKPKAEEDSLLLRWQNLSIQERRKVSLERFLALPESAAVDGPSSKISRFQAQDPRAAASMRLGDTQQDRTSELHKASCGCDIMRMLALLEAGVNVDVANEYGQTAVFLAAYHDAGEAIKLLAWAGADVDRVANGGTSPWMCAASNKCQGAMKELAEAGAVTSALGLSKPDSAPHSAGPELTWLIPVDSDLAGAGSCLVNGGFSEAFLHQLEQLFQSLPVAPNTKACSSDRSYYCDSEGWIRQAFDKALEGIEELGVGHVTMPHMRFLHYSEVGGGLPAHVDLARTDEMGRRSTHTFILYLWNASLCESESSAGGETVLLNRMEDSAAATVVAVEPRRGRLLLFPHMCPHLARPIASPKLLLRGEMRLEMPSLQSCDELRLDS